MTPRKQAPSPRQIKTPAAAGNSRGSIPATTAATVKIKARQNGAIIDLLQTEFGTASRTRVRKMLKYNMVRVNGHPVTHANFAISAGDRIEYEKITGRSKKTIAPIYFEDESILVAIKPAGLLTHGARNTGGTSLYKILKDFIRDRSNDREGLYMVHRIDREVAGLVLFAKTEQVQNQLKTNWKDARKKYHALVEGHPREEEGTIRSFLMEQPNRRMASTTEPGQGKLAVTHYRILKKLPSHTLLEIRTDTGRKNQIRAHLSEMGCPIAGDRRYGADTRFLRRIRLHASYLGFPHPSTGRFIEFQHPMPDGFLTLRDKNEK